MVRVHGRAWTRVLDQPSRIAVILILLLIISAGLYLNTGAWAGEKAHLEKKLRNIESRFAEVSNQLVDFQSVKASLESKLAEITVDRDRLNSELGDQKADHATSESKVTALEEQVRVLGSDSVQFETTSRTRYEALEADHQRVTAAKDKCFEEKKVMSQLTGYGGPKRALSKDSALSNALSNEKMVTQSWLPEFQAGKIPVWVWWEFPDGIPTAYRLNLRSWLRHMPASKFELRLVSKHNIKDYYPEIPDAFYRMYQLAQSDFVRSSMLAIHGGVYLDGDMMLREDLDVVFKDVWEGKADIMPYLFDYQKCRESFSTNFLAGRKANLLSQAWYEKVLDMLNSSCPKDIDPNNDGNYVFTEERACCRDRKGNPRRRCYVAFGAAGDRAAHNVMKKIDKDGPENSGLTMNCIEKYWGMAANASGCNGELLWKQFLPGAPEGFVPPTLPFGQIPEPDRRGEKCWQVGVDLRCTASGMYPNFFKRHGFHLFNSFNSDLMFGFKTDDELLESGSVIAELYKEALLGEDPNDTRYAELGIKNRGLHDNDRAEFKMWGDTQKIKMPWLEALPGFAERITQRRASGDWNH